MSKLMMSASSVASLLAHAFGPSYYDSPHFDHGGPVGRVIADLAAGPHPEPWRQRALNPQPLPPRAAQALALADAHIQEVLALDRMGSLLGGEAMERAEGRALRLLAEVDELCPRWPRWPGHWPPPPPPPFGEHDEMEATELLLFGARLLAASELLDQGRLQSALAALGEKAMGLSLPSEGRLGTTVAA